MKTVETTVLKNGVNIPKLGLGTYKTSGEEVTNAVGVALANGYTSIDTARFYENEKDIAKAIKMSGIARRDLFITSKLWNTYHGYDSTMRSFEDSLKQLETDYLDLYLIHWPGRDKYVETWKAFETLYKEKRIRAIGVSNFLRHHLETLLDHCDVEPMVDQIETHAYYMDENTIGFCQGSNIKVEAWAPLGRGALLKDPVLTKIANRHGKTPAQTALRFLLQNDIIVIPKSVHENRIRENINVFDFELTGSEMEAIRALNKNERIFSDPDKMLF
jgi:diketogulonate reductase-like aldo/keto reductase